MDTMSLFDILPIPSIKRNLSKKQRLRLLLICVILAEQKACIQMITLELGSSSIFRLTDNDWVSITGLEIAYRNLFEAVVIEFWSHFEKLWNES